MDVIFDTAGIPADDRVPAWEDAAGQVPVRLRMRFLDQAFNARVSTTRLGAVDLTMATSSSLVVERTGKDIRQSDPDHYLFSLCRAGFHSTAQVCNRHLARPEDLVLYDSSRPFVSSFQLGHSSLYLHLPKRLLATPSRVVDRILAVPLPGKQGMGRVLAQFLNTIAVERVPYSGPDAARLGDTAIDLVEALLAHCSAGDPVPARQSPPNVLFLRVKDFIDRNLADPALKPALIAEVHHISLRYLHRVFQQHGTSVAAHIRARRLDRCRRDLANPALVHVPVHAIGARWGFPVPSDFSRAFHSAHGVPPGEYRARCR
ncbi:helix-turn-helix domain-containing protein [Saccharothrix obliqua]|uniref:helix-turn-helix domain-containing protein n=1 Tax=Saccharothrix obliqua TaxID=2861747 RepID=UPI001C6017D9|nr:helix-turn-helix domain-containing protein [Saccharothrix obliqua]MBW4718833.1 helix-turn-helix domain-containing protein [Saccharothrix obliqua]